MKKISRILMCASLLLGFAACSDSDSGDDGDNNGTQLAAPVLAQSSVEETAFTVTWQAVEHANVYAIRSMAALKRPRPKPPPV